MLGLVLFLGALLSVQGQTTIVNQCTRTQGPLPINVYIEGCINQPCQLAQKQNAVVNIVFRAPRVLETMTTRARAYLPGILLGIPYDLGANSRTCNFLENTYCPVMEGEIVKYTLNMYIEEFFPAGTNANIEFIVEGDRGDVIFCLRAGITITPPLAEKMTPLITAEDSHIEDSIRKNIE